MGGEVATYKEVVGNAVEGLIFCLLIIGRDGLHGEQSADGDFSAVIQGDNNICGVIDDVPLRRHTAFGAVDGVIEIVTREHDGEIDPIWYRVSV